MAALGNGLTLRQKKALIGFIFVIPALVYFTVFRFYPVGNAVYTSFMRYNLLSRDPWTFIGVDNYITLYESARFWNAVEATAVFTIGAFIPLVVFSLLFALLITSRHRGIRHLQVAIFAPVVIPGVVGSLVWLMILDPRGIANQAMNFLTGMSGVDWRWVSSGDMTRISSMLVYFWSYVGFFTIIFTAGLGSIPADLKEAAYIDGATAGQRFRSITLPLLKPTTLVVSIMAMIFCMRTFSVQYVFANTGGAPRRPIHVVTFFIYDTAMRDHQMGLATAASVLLMLAMLVFSIIQLRVGRQSDR